MSASHGWVLVLCLALFGVCCGGGIRQDELVCEEAVKHLTQCCAGLTPTGIDCTYQTVTGDPNYPNGPSYPDLSPTESDCIRNESCETLLSSGVCGRAIDLVRADMANAENPYLTGLPPNFSAYNPSQICP